ncbi:MAG: FMN-binding protein [Planctomycetaceae bacterium]|nr:FMN-binding protein [Planctomycetaceae bacterium]
MTLNTRSPAYVIVFATAASAVFTVAIMALYQFTEPTAKLNARLAEDKAVVEMFDLADASTLTDRQIVDLVRRRVAGPIALPDPQGGSVNVWIAYAGDAPTTPDLRDRANVQAYAFDISGVGFWATIRGRMAVSADLKTVVGVVFLSHSETPGLGGRISSDAKWRQTFRGLDITPGGGAKLIYINNVAPETGPPQHGRHVDAITGATGTSTAVETFVRKDLDRFRRAAAAAGLGAGGQP